MKAYLGIDIGTSAVKSIVLTEKGHILGSGSSDFDVVVPKPGYAEQNPEDWWNGTVISIKAALDSCTTKPEVVAIGVTGQMVGSVLMDSDGKADEQCIIWMDQRASKECEYIKNKLGEETILDRTANIAFVSLWAPKLLWLRENDPERYSRIEKVLFPKDYIKYRLTGEYDIDVSDSTSTLLFNTAERRWEPSLFEKLDIPRSFVPGEASESSEIIGHLSSHISDLLGLPKGIPVVSGGGDQLCGAAGLGIVRSGLVSSTIGTSGVVFAYSDSCLTDRMGRAIICNCHCIPDAWGIYGCTLAAGGSYKWLRDILLKSNDEQSYYTYEVMNSMAAEVKPGCEGLLFLPYLSGERTPHADPYSRGVFFGLSQRSATADICRAVMEGVTYSLRDTIEAFKEYGIPVTQVRVAGGGARSGLWRQLQADIFGAEVVLTNVIESTATGAAMLGAVGIGDYADMEQAADDIVQVIEKCEPNYENMQLYNDFYETYRDLYPAIRSLYESQAKKVEKWN